MPTQVMLGQLPLLVAPKIDTGLIIGYATGVTVGAMLQSPVQSVTCVELEPGTVAGSSFFNHINNRPLDDPRTNLIIDDARTFLRVTPNRARASGRRRTMGTVGADLPVVDGELAIGAGDVSQSIPARAGVSCWRAE
jgi:hypothetical protein